MTEIRSTAIEAAAREMELWQWGPEGADLAPMVRHILKASGLPTQLQAAQERAEQAEASAGEDATHIERLETLIATKVAKIERLLERAERAEAERDQLASQLQEARGIIERLSGYVSDVAEQLAPIRTDVERFLTA